MNTKAEFRNHMRKILSEHGNEEIATKSATIMRRIYSMEEYANSKVIFTYISKRGEVETRGLIKHALESGKTVAVPAISPEKRKLTVHPICSLEETLKGEYGILEPKDRESCVPPSRIDVAFVPGLAFDEFGNRLGRGKGYFDNLLTKFNCRIIGLAFEFQVFQKVPSAKHDIRMEKIITDKRVMAWE